MAIVDLAYYTTAYMGQEASECDFPALEARAEDVIGMMTRWTVTADTFATLSAVNQMLVKKAICAQLDWLAANGLDALSGGSLAENGFTVGKVSVNGAMQMPTQNELKKGKLAAYIAPLALAYLEQTGLMNPQVTTGPDMPLIGWWW